MSNTRSKSSNNSNTSQAAESSDSDTYEDKILAFMGPPFNLSRADAEAQSLSIYKKDSPMVVDEPQAVLFYFLCTSKASIDFHLAIRFL